MRLKKLPKSSAQIQIEKLLVEAEQLKTALIQKDNTIQSLQNQLRTQAQLTQDYNTQLTQARTDLSNKEAYINTIIENNRLKIENLQPRLQEEKIQNPSPDTLNYDLYLYQDLRIKELEKQVEQLTLTINPENCNLTLPPTNRSYVKLGSYTFNDFEERQKLDADIKSIEKEFKTKLSSLKVHRSFSAPLLSPAELVNRFVKDKFIKNEVQRFNDFTDSNLKNSNITPKINGLCKKIEHGINSYEYILEESDKENSYIELIGNSGDGN